MKMGKWQVTLFRNRFKEPEDSLDVQVPARSAEEALGRAEAKYLSEGGEFVRMGRPKMIERARPIDESVAKELHVAEPA